MSKSFNILITLIGFLIVNMATEQTGPTNELGDVGRNLATFSASLHKKICDNSVDNENKVISPLSVAAVLSMIYPAAKENTSLQLEKTLHLENNIENKQLASKMGDLLKSLKGGKQHTLETANRVYASSNYQVRESYQTMLKQHFGVAAECLDFQETEKATAAINDWVEETTHNKIKTLIPKGALDAFTRLVLVNAVYFKGNWETKFDPSKTSAQPFYFSSEQEPIAVHMMHNYAQYNTANLPDLKARILELPYEGGQVSMFIILPESWDDLPEIESALLTLDVLGEAQKQMENHKISVVIPKFEIEFETSMKSVLQTLGLTDLFDEKRADLSGMSGRNDLFVSDVFHKAFIEVNEEGSEAAAATAGAMRLKRSLDVNEPFIVDRPCTFIVQHKPSGLWLFTGRLNKPQAAEPKTPHREEL